MRILYGRTLPNVPKTTDNDAYTGPILSAIYMPASATVYNPLDGSYGGVTTEDPAYIEKYGSNFSDIHGGCCKSGTSIGSREFV